MRQAVKFGMSFLASRESKNFRTFLLLCISDKILTLKSCVPTGKLRSDWYIRLLTDVDGSFYDIGANNMK